MNTAVNYSQLLRSIRKICVSKDTLDQKLSKVCILLQANIAYYDWVGFYLTDPNKERELVLGPYIGAPTEHTRIPYGQGICGQAADLEKTFIVQDVTLEPNYLSCSPDVRAEIVLPIFKNGSVVGELDIDSHDLAPFTGEDQQFLTELCSIVSELF